jgi:hypothetical protein
MRTSYDCTSHVQDLGGHVNELQQESNNHKNISICNVVESVRAPTHHGQNFGAQNELACSI